MHGYDPKGQRLNLRNANDRKELALAFGWRTVWQRLIAKLEQEIATCTHGDARHPSHRLQKELRQARLELAWLEQNKKDANHG